MKVVITNSAIILAVGMVSVLIAMALLNVVAPAMAASSPMASDPAPLRGITFSGSFDYADTAYLRNSLGFLRDVLPEWYAYIVQAEPFVLSIDQDLEPRGIISNAKCCYTRGVGVITFGQHLGRWSTSTMASSEGMQVQQIQFLSVLVHEVTHIRDQREGRIGEAVDSKTCIAAEGSANTQELEFVRALATVQIHGDSNAQENYRLVVDKHLQITEENIEGVSWKIACLLFYPD